MIGNKGYKANAAHLLREMSDAVADQLTRRWFFESEIAQAIGAKFSESVCAKWGGLAVHLPMDETSARLTEKNKSELLEFVADLGAFVSTHLQECAQVRAAEAGGIGAKIAATVADILRGQELYIPRLAHKLTERNAQISARLTRDNANELAREFGMSRVRIYQIAKAHRTGKSRPSTAPLHAQPVPSTVPGSRWAATEITEEEATQ